jgi:hypothetical protein
MAYTKRRVVQHWMEDRSIRIVRERLPDHWVIREYRPDYGIDLTIELFEFVDEERTTAATLGETLFVQVKSMEVVELGLLRVYPRDNVERGPLREDRSESTEIQVARLPLETSELLTVQAMGSAVPVLLFLVELSAGRVYYVCLNDLIEKVIIPEDPSYEEKGSKVLHIPARNRIVQENPATLRPLETYAKRSNLYAAFEKFAYQKHELEYALGSFAGCADGGTAGGERTKPDGPRAALSPCRAAVRLLDADTRVGADRVLASGADGAGRAPCESRLPRRSAGPALVSADGAGDEA